MRGGADRKRVAFALFENSQRLCRVLGDFETAGFNAQQMGVAGRASAISAFAKVLHANMSRPARADHLISELVPLSVVANEEKLVASGGPFWPTLQCFGIRPEDDLVSAPWMTPRLRDELAAHIIDGAILFGIRAATVEQHKVSTQNLLQHSTHRVHTHEF